MRRAIFIAVILAVVPAGLAESALDAVKLLPPGEAARIARIEGREGSPDPERWYIQTQDPTAENGVHEFVVSNGQIVASRSVSQFADSLTPGDILGDVTVINSDKAARLACSYAAANSGTFATINYDLRKDPATGTPTWTISCIDATGTKLGSIVVTATTGDVISHDGFPIEPAPAATRSLVAENKELHPETHANPDAAGEPIIHHHHHLPSPTPTPKSVITKTFDTVGHTLQKILPF
jgi:hypothetical protein